MTQENEEPQNVVVTGAADSVARVMAEAFVARGDRVHICDVREEALAETLGSNPKMRGTVANVGIPAQVEKVFEEAFDWMGYVDVLLNVVGIGGPRAAVEDISYQEWEESITINLNGYFYCVRQVVPKMKERRHGSILCFSTGSTRTAVPLRTPYVASKAGVEGLTRCLARELGPYNIRCNAILPGAINNARLDRLIQRNADARGISAAEFEGELLKYISMRKRIELEEFADLVLFLSSDQGKSITGQLIELGGNVEWEES